MLQWDSRQTKRGLLCIAQSFRNRHQNRMFYSQSILANSMDPFAIVFPGFCWIIHGSQGGAVMAPCPFARINKSPMRACDWSAGRLRSSSVFVGPFLSSQKLGPSAGWGWEWEWEWMGVLPPSESSCPPLESFQPPLRSFLPPF